VGDAATSYRRINKDQKSLETDTGGLDGKPVAQIKRGSSKVKMESKGGPAWPTQKTGNVNKKENSSRLLGVLAKAISY